jgi:hypothetical protein
MEDGRADQTRALNGGPVGVAALEHHGLKTQLVPVPPCNAAVAPRVCGMGEAAARSPSEDRPLTLATT